MTLKIYNTLTRKKEPFKEIKKGKVLMYTCGPTVYNYLHIGNFKTFIAADILKRYLEYKGYEVKHIMNITDIDDKTIRDSGKAGMSLKEFTDKYTNEFFKDIETLNIKKATLYPRATECVPKAIEITKKLIEKGFAYEKLGSVYFEISKFKDYGKLSKVDLTQMKAGARVDLDEYEKENPVDFTLFKRSTSDELRREIYYDAPWGKSRPGWHIECSTMSLLHLGETIDIHTGGVDLIFPHHENEIAQSEAYNGKKFVNYWIHCEHLLVDGKKMSKSLGNFYTLRDLLKRNYKPKGIRYALMSTQYSQKLNFTLRGLEAAENSVQRLSDFMNNIKEISDVDENKNIETLIKKAKEDFEKEMDDDLNISAALAAIFTFVKDVNKAIYDNKGISKKDSKKIVELMMDFDKVLAILEEKEQEIPEEIKDMVKQRENARKEKNFANADSIRDALKEKGYVLEDSAQGPKIKRI